MAHYDLVIIGTGSGNPLVTPDFAEKKVAIIEKGVFGGTCLNVGCIPTKMFVQAAEVARSARESSRLGVDASVQHVRWSDIRERVFGRIDPIALGGREYRERGSEDGNTTVYSGHARFTGDHSLRVDGYDEEVTGDQIVIATGARPVIPAVITDSGVPYETSDTVMRIADLPSSLVIVGGGFIALEFAHVFSSLGVDVTMVLRGERVLRHADDDVSQTLTNAVENQWTLVRNAELTSAGHGADGVELALSDGRTVNGDLLLVATGRRPNTDDLSLENTGVEVRPDGRVVVDEYGRTGVDGVWSLGDASSPFQLKHVANAEERCVAHNLVHPNDLRPFPHDVVPSAVFTHPQVATVGMSEAQARAAGHDVTVKVQAYGATAYGWALEDTSSICKVIADKETRKLLGVHFVGPDASTLIQPAIQAMSFGLAADEMARGQYWIHPALTEVLENALLGLEFPPHDA